jgi:anionic cell wall polymer biosynthesis LytR-Cps2A-Psr (LCP) family protein/TM2 domain-containing membrane protein YozV
MSTNPSPALAALLSFLFPGLGQFYAGDLRKALLWAVPMLLFILGIIWLLLGGTIGMIALITNAQTRVALLVLNVAFFLYHVAAMVDAYSMAKAARGYGYSRSGGTAPIALAALVALTMVLHGVPETIGVDANNAIEVLFPGHSDVIPSYSPLPTQAPTITPSVTPTPFVTATPGTSGEPTGQPTPTGSVGPTATPRACPPIDLSGWAMAADGRVNLLLTGSDSRSDTGVGTSSIRTDSMMLLSIDIASCKAALFSFPRNMNCDIRYPTWFHIPLESGQDFPDCLNALWRSAAANPGAYRGSEGIGSECQQQFDCIRGWRALTGAIQNMAGQRIDGVVAVNLKGFVALVSALPGHGVWIDVPYHLQDLPEPCPPPNQDKTCQYFNSQQQPMRVDFQPGCQFLNGEEALAFARSRHQDSDYFRARRQQIFLQQVRRQLDPLALLTNMNDLLLAAEQNLFMTLAQSDIPFLAQVGSRIDADRLYRYDFAPNKLDAVGSMAGMTAKIQNIFSEPEPVPDPNDQQDPCPPRN